MSTNTNNLGLFKWDKNNATDKASQFDIDRALNDNWDKIDNEAGNKNEQIEELKSQIPTGTVSGNDITINDSSNMNVISVAIKGRTSQTTTNDSPSPAQRQDVHFVTGNCEIKEIGKNVYRGIRNEFTYGGVTLKGDNKYFHLNGTATQSFKHEFGTTRLKAGTYTLMLKLISGSLTGSDNIFYLYKTGSWDTISGATITINSTNLQGQCTFTLAEDTNISVSPYVYSGRVFSNTKIAYQIVKGSVADFDFVPYQHQTCPLSLGNTNLYEGDSIDIEYEENAGYKTITNASIKTSWNKITFNGTEGFASSYIHDTDSQFWLSTSSLTWNGSISNVLCNYFKTSRY